jgi:hypothetical protein
MSDLEKRLTRLEKIVLIGFTSVIFFQVGRTALDWYVLDKTRDEIEQQACTLKKEAKKALELKEIEWEMKINAVPYQAIKALEDVANKCMKKYYPDIDTNLPIEEKYHLVCNRLTKEGKEEFKQEFNTKAYDLIEKLKNDFDNISNEELRKYVKKFIDIAIYESEE